MAYPSPDTCEHDFEIRCRKCRHVGAPLPPSDLEVIAAKLNRRVIDQNAQISRLGWGQNALERPRSDSVPLTDPFLCPCCGK